MSDSPDSESALVPIGGAERLLTVDVLRGFALLGILLANMKTFARPMYADVFVAPHWGRADAFAASAVSFLTEGKFYPLFSLLFGLGLFIQLSRARERGQRFVPFFLRRLAVLAGIGLVHGLLIWSGDILVVYSVVGVPLLLLRNVSSRTLLVLAALCFTVPCGRTLERLVRSELARGTPVAAEIRRDRALERERMVEAVGHGEAAYRGGYLDATRQRAREVLLYYRMVVPAAFVIFAMYLLGVWMGRRGLLHDPGAHRRFFRRALVITFALGVVPDLLRLWLFDPSRGPPSFAARIVFNLGIFIGGPCLGFAYLSGLALLLQREAWRRRLAPLAALGRMSLSNYLFQSVVCTLLFYGYGLGLLNKVEPAGQCLIAFGVYATQLVLSMWWTARFRFGPVEWLWRSLSYGQRQPLRRAAPAPASA